MATIPCKIWTGAKTNSGYGQQWNPEGSDLVHRQEWEKYNGPIPEGMVVAHICDNRACHEISHFFICTQSENMMDCVHKGRHKGGRIKLTKEQVLEIRARNPLDPAESSYALADKYGVTKDTINKVLNRNTWKHV
jgi:hypothetical protein